MPRFDIEDEDDDRPRRPRRKKRKPAAPSWPKWVAGGVALVVCIAIAFFVLKGLGRNSNPGGGVGGAPVAGGVKYVPRESEKKFGEFLKAHKDEGQITEAEVYAIMGEPTRREAPISGVKNGFAFTIYTAHWDVPGSGISSQISFVNGRLGGMILGLEVGGQK